jgi:hypothetical protein
MIVSPRSLHEAPLVVRRRILIVVPRPLPAVPLVERCKYLCDHVALAVARGTATLPQQEKNNSEDVQREIINSSILFAAEAR